MANKWENNGHRDSLISWAPKALQIVTTAMKLKDACCLESYDKPRQHMQKQKHHFANKGPYSQSYSFFSSHVWMWELDYKEADCQRIDAFELWCLDATSELWVPWTVRRSNQSILNEINSEYSLEGLMLKLKLQYFCHLMRRADSLEDTDAEKDWRQKEKWATEDEIVR